MQDVLAVMGVPAQHLMLENESRDTHDNAVNSAQLLKARGMHRILLVTSAYHMRRSVALFEAQGLEVVPAPTDYQQLVAKQVLPDWLPASEQSVPDHRCPARDRGLLGLPLEGLAVTLASSYKPARRRPSGTVRYSGASCTRCTSDPSSAGRRGRSC